MLCNRIHLIVFVLWCVSEAYSTQTCPVPSTGETGSKSSVRISVYKCVQATSSSKPVCLNDPVSVKTVEKGETVDLEYDVNDYAVTAKFFGKETCVAYRKKSKLQTSSGITIAPSCESECFVDEEYETYDSDLVCSSLGCLGGRNKLKFVAKSVMVKSSIAVIILCFTLFHLYIA